MSKRRKKKMRTYHFEDYMKQGLREGVTLPHYIRACKEAMSTSPVNDANNIVSSVFYMHFMNQQQTFDISEKMMDMFLKTDLHGVQPDDIRLPYPCLYVAVPKGRFRLWDPSSGFHECNGVYLRETTERENKEGGNCPFVMVFSCLANSASSSYADDMHNWIPMSNLQNPEAFDDLRENLKNMKVKKILGDTPFSELEDRLGVKVALFMENLKTSSTVTNEALETMAFSMMSIGKIALNLLVYLNHGLEVKKVQDQIRPPIQYHMDKHKTSNNDKHGRMVTRLSIANVHSLEVSVKRIGGLKATDILVRGHWRTYWVGKGRKERLLKWIQPYIRNPDTGVPTNKTRKYIV